MGTKTSEYTAAERRVDMMKYLCQVGHATMPELARTYRVSVKTIKRDINELGSFIPLETKVGRHSGGVYVMEGYRWNKTYMSAADIALLTKIKRIGEKQQELVLSKDDLSRLSKIISIYSA